MLINNAKYSVQLQVCSTLYIKSLQPCYPTIVIDGFQLYVYNSMFTLQMEYRRKAREVIAPSQFISLLMLLILLCDICLSLPLYNLHLGLNQYAYYIVSLFQFYYYTLICIVSKKGHLVHRNVNRKQKRKSNCVIMLFFSYCYRNHVVM